MALADSEAHFRALVEQAFNKDIPGDSDYEAITKTIITMCKNLNRTLVAEGVETAEQWDFLKRHQCDQVQGYCLCAPVSGKEFFAYYRQRRSTSRGRSTDVSNVAGALGKE